MLTSERIFKLMGERGMSLVEFSRQTGIAQSTISDWKRKGNNPSSDKIMAICKVLNVSPYELLQDTYNTDNKHEVDYIIISKGTDNYELVSLFERLSPSNKDRVLGFISALVENI